MNSTIKVCIGYVVKGEPLSLPDGEYMLIPIAAAPAIAAPTEVERDTKRWRAFEKALRTGHFQGPAHGRRFKIIETCPMYGDEKEFNDFIGTIDAAIATGEKK